MSAPLLVHLQAALSQEYEALVCQVPLIDEPEEIEALHDTRIALRRLRSLLLPWRGQGGLFAQVDQLAAELGRETGPWRDKQVLVAELERLGLGYQATVRREVLHTGLGVVGGDPLFELLLASVRALQLQLATAPAASISPGVLSDYTTKAMAKLRGALKSPDFDLHEIRKKIKKLRYVFQAYPNHTGPGSKLRRKLDQAQSELGNWHDRFQWLLVAEREPDLHCCRALWQAEEERRGRRARRCLAKLSLLLKRERQARFSAGQ